ncbi:MAG TPA: TIGR03557 family F420-dependent LLM class oxidoreductase [Chloroflexota bacterium]
MIQREERSIPGAALSDTSKAAIGFVLSHEQFPVTQLVEFAPRAEQAGFDALSTSDHFQPWQANQGHVGFAWVTLAAAGARTQRIPFGTAVTCPSFRYNPAIVAEAFSSLGLLYPGRVFLGVGSGEALNEVTAGGGWGDYNERTARLVEAVHVIRRLWTGETVNHQGDYFQVKNARLYDIPSTPVPIYIAAGGPESARLAGEHGDGLITDSKSAVKPEMRQAFEEGARAAGKDPGSMPIIAELFVCTGDRAEAEKGAELWRYLPKAWTEFVEDPDPVDIMRRAQQEVPLDEVLNMMFVSTDPAEHAKSLQGLIDGGVTTILVHSAQEDQLSVIDFYGSQVLPRVQRRSPVASR